MTEGVQLKIIPDAYGPMAEVMTNDFMKGKNILATQVIKDNVWIWYKTTPDKGYDGFDVPESKD